MQIDSYKKLPLGKYSEIVAVLKDESLEDIDKQVKVVALLNDMDEDDVLNLPITEFSKLNFAASFLQEPCEDDKSRVAESYTFGDLVLLPVKSTDKITTSQYIDFQNFAKDYENNIVGLLSCLLVPKGKTYGNGYDIADVHKAISDSLSVFDAFALLSFFFDSLTLSVKDSLTYLQKKMRRMERMKNRNK